MSLPPINLGRPPLHKKSPSDKTAWGESGSRNLSSLETAPTLSPSASAAVRVSARAFPSTPGSSGPSLSLPRLALPSPKSEAGSPAESPSASKARRNRYSPVTPTKFVPIKNSPSSELVSDDPSPVTSPSPSPAKKSSPALGNVLELPTLALADSDSESASSSPMIPPFTFKPIKRSPLAREASPIIPKSLPPIAAVTDPLFDKIERPFTPPSPITANTPIAPTIEPDLTVKDFDDGFSLSEIPLSVQQEKPKEKVKTEARTAKIHDIDFKHDKEKLPSSVKPSASPKSLFDLIKTPR